MAHPRKSCEFRLRRLRGSLVGSRGGRAVASVPGIRDLQLQQLALAADSLHTDPADPPPTPCVPRTKIASRTQRRGQKSPAASSGPPLWGLRASGSVLLTEAASWRGAPRPRGLQAHPNIFGVHPGAGFFPHTQGTWGYWTKTPLMKIHWIPAVVSTANAAPRGADPAASMNFASK